MISGQTDFPDAQWVEKTTGRAPVILALDFMRAPARMGGEKDNLDKAVLWAKRGGIVAFQWHWVSPTGTDDKGQGFYTKSTKFDLAHTLDHPDSADYKEMLKDIDDVASQLATLQKAGVPVLFRPLHEAQGTWFWWGAKGAEPCKRLYKLIFDRMTKKHGVHNLLWVWNVYPASEKKGDPATWYPGNSLVDVLATDYLDRPADYKALSDLCGGTKLLAVAETMNPPKPRASIDAGATWAYWVTWARRDWNAKSEADVAAAMRDPLTLTLESQ